MCLDYLSTEKQIRECPGIPGEKPIKTGWKVFTYDPGADTLFGECMARQREYRVRRWIKAGEIRGPVKIKTIRGQTTSERYRAGFHVFLRRRDAVEYFKTTSGVALRLVSMRSITSYGMQDIGPWGIQNLVPVAVAQEIYIYPEP